VQCLLSEKAVRESEELRRGREELRREEVQGREDSRRERKHKLDEWSSLQLSLRALRQDLLNPLMGDGEKKDIEEDIERIKRRKNNLAAKDLEMEERQE
jgi:hypothetical protein